jgi:O-succinylbenzoate synthase
VDLELRPFRIPLRLPFRGLRERTGLLVRRGSRWAEFSPFADYPPHLRRRWFGSTMEQLTESDHQVLRDRIPINVTVPAIDPADAHSLVSRSGCSTAKVKVGDPEDEARVEAVRDALGPRGKLRVDVNARWTVDQAALKLKSLDRYDLQYAEQPVASIDELRALRSRVDVPIAIDETLRTATDPERIDTAGAADVVVLKVAPLGGIERTLRLAERAGLPVVISSALETSVGMAAGIMCAARLPELDLACGLGTVALFEDDLVVDPLVERDGFIAVENPTVDEAALARHELTGPEADRLRRWFNDELEARA